MFDIQLLESDILTNICHRFRISHPRTRNDKLLFFPAREGKEATKTYLKNIYNIFEAVEMQDAFERFLNGETKYNPINSTTIFSLSNGKSYEFYHILSFLDEEMNFIEKFIHQLGINEKKFRFVYEHNKSLWFRLEEIFHPSKEDIDNLFNFLNFYSEKFSVDTGGNCTYEFTVKEIPFKISISRAMVNFIIKERKKSKKEKNYADYNLQ